MRVALTVGLPLLGVGDKQFAGFSQYLKTNLNGDCTVEDVDADCDCTHYSYKYKGYVCDSCVDKRKWGYGCRLNCPTDQCAHNCDFAGNCRLNFCPKGCKEQKRNQAVAERSRTSQGPKGCLNQRGECEACERGKWGMICEKDCAPNCKDSVEGVCDRTGACFADCKLGWFGANCTDACPSACPECLRFEANVSGQILPAGACKQNCQNLDGSPKDNWGATCTEVCPTNCDKHTLQSMQGVPSCARASGKCLLCQSGWFGDSCDKTCRSGCRDDRCHQQTGMCTAGCDDTHWGNMCQNVCPDNTKTGCERGTGMPNSCNDMFFPKIVGQTAECANCPAHCRSQFCDPEGKCTVAGCENGYWGTTCDNRCPEGCRLACNQADGLCTGLVPMNLRDNKERDILDSNTEYIPDAVPSCTRFRTLPVAAGGGAFTLEGLDIPAGTEVLYDKGALKGLGKQKISHLETNGPGATIYFKFPACSDGWTGGSCNVPCHGTCGRCIQFKTVSGQQAPGNGEADCMRCVNSQPSHMLEAGPGLCECIADATRTNNTGMCVCNFPDDPKRQAKFDMGSRPPRSKRCRQPCKRGTQEAHGADNSAVCLGNSVVRMMWKNDKAIMSRGAGTCPKGPDGASLWQVDDAADVCVREDYVRYIIEDEEEEGFLETSALLQVRAARKARALQRLDDEEAAIRRGEDVHVYRGMAKCDKEKGPEKGSCPVGKCKPPPVGCKAKDLFVPSANGTQCCPKLCYYVDKDGKECKEKKQQPEEASFVQVQAKAAAMACPPPAAAPVRAPSPSPPWPGPGCMTKACCIRIRSRASCSRKTGCRWDVTTCKFSRDKNADGGAEIRITIRIYDGIKNIPIPNATVTVVQTGGPGSPAIVSDDAPAGPQFTGEDGKLPPYLTTDKSHVEVKVTKEGYEMADSMFFVASCDLTTADCPPIFMTKTLVGQWESSRCFSSGSVWEARAFLRWGKNPADLDAYAKDISGQCLTPADRITRSWVMWRAHNDKRYDPEGIQHRPVCKQPAGGSITLDYDVTDGDGPESMTFANLAPGTYIYAVHRYEGMPEGDLSTSNAVVDVFIGRQHFMCRIDATDCSGAKRSDMWVPFELVVSDTKRLDHAFNPPKKVYKVAVRGGKGAGGIPASPVTPLPYIQAPRDEMQAKAQGRLMKSPCEDVFSTACREWWDPRKVCRGGCIEVPKNCLA